MDDFAICYVTGEEIHDETLVSIYSLLENNSQGNYELVVFDININEDFNSKLESLFSEYPEIEYKYKIIEKEKLKFVPKDSGMFHWAVNILLLLPNLLPDDIHWILYLDYDTIVYDNIMDIIDHMDHKFDVLGVMEEVRLAQANIDQVVKYVNTGVLLMNATSWRQKALSDVLLTYVRQTNPKYPDQNAVNSQISFNNIGLLPLQYNFSRSMWDQTRIEFDKSDLQPKIIHFWGPWKPWHKFSDHELDMLWDSYQQTCPVPLDINQYKSGLMIDFIESIILQNMDFDTKLRRVMNHILFS